MCLLLMATLNNMTLINISEENTWSKTVTNTFEQIESLKHLLQPLNEMESNLVFKNYKQHDNPLISYKNL
jgi:hypothetical protein